MRQFLDELEIETSASFETHDLNPRLDDLVTQSGIRTGFLTARSVHTTTALVLNEYEDRLLTDIRDFFLKLAPPERRYLHNDIDQRDCPPDEPENAHSHLAAMLLGSSEVVPVNEGGLVLGQYQSIMLVELDGSRERNLTVQICGE